MNSGLKACNTVDHLQHSSNGTSIQKKAPSYTSGELGWNPKDYIKEMNPSKETEETLEEKNSNLRTSPCIRNLNIASSAKPEEVLFPYSVLLLLFSKS